MSDNCRLSLHFLAAFESFCWPLSDFVELVVFLGSNFEPTLTRGTLVWEAVVDFDFFLALPLADLVLFEPFDFFEDTERRLDGFFKLVPLCGRLLDLLWGSPPLVVVAVVAVSRDLLCMLLLDLSPSSVLLEPV